MDTIQEFVESLEIFQKDVSDNICQFNELDASYQNVVTTIESRQIKLLKTWSQCKGSRSNNFSIEYEMILAQYRQVNAIASKKARLSKSTYALMHDYIEKINSLAQNYEKNTQWENAALVKAVQGKLRNFLTADSLIQLQHYIKAKELDANAEKKRDDEVVFVKIGNDDKEVRLPKLRKIVWPANLPKDIHSPGSWKMNTLEVLRNELQSTLNFINASRSPKKVPIPKTCPVLVGTGRSSKVPPPTPILQATPSGQWQQVRTETGKRNTKVTPQPNIATKKAISESVPLIVSPIVPLNIPLTIQPIVPSIVQPTLPSIVPSIVQPIIPPSVLPTILPSNVPSAVTSTVPPIVQQNASKVKSVSEKSANGITQAPIILTFKKENVGWSLIKQECKQEEKEDNKVTETKPASPIELNVDLLKSEPISSASEQDLSGDGFDNAITTLAPGTSRELEYDAVISLEEMAAGAASTSTLKDTLEIERFNQLHLCESRLKQISQSITYVEQNPMLQKQLIIGENANPLQNQQITAGKRPNSQEWYNLFTSWEMNKPVKHKKKRRKENRNVASTVIKVPKQMLVSEPSSDCRIEEDDGRMYCICNQEAYGNMIACDNEGCSMEWFHYTCVGITEVPENDWYCPRCTKKRKGMKKR